ncbi:MAG: HAMP domain-containing sensor histidine kinase, partial [Kovacikia sp.]
YTHWVSIQRDITHRKQLEEELLKTLEKEKELSELKSRFVSMTSHEFRTPLSTIYSSSELLEYYEHRWTREERLDQLHLIQSTVEHMTQLLEDILLIGQAEADHLEFHPTPINLPQFCSELTNHLQLSIGSNHTLAFLNQCSTVRAWVDEKLLRQILTNLLSNGVKYAPEGSLIQLELTCDSEQIILRIQDQGIGIPPEDHAHLFEAFHRAKNVGTIPGTGLGLAIVKRCVEVHNGSITFQSEVGVGTTFEVTLPLEVEP